MDLDIFKRKMYSRGFSCPRTENGFVIYKAINIIREGKSVEFTVQSNSLSEKTGASEMQLTLTRFADKPDAEITAAVIFCKSLEEMSLACVQLDLLASDSMKSPFEEAVTGKELKYHFRRSTWTKK